MICGVFGCQLVHFIGCYSTHSVLSIVVNILYITMYVAVQMN